MRLLARAAGLMAALHSKFHSNLEVRGGQGRLGRSLLGNDAVDEVLRRCHVNVGRGEVHFDRVPTILLFLLVEQKKGRRAKTSHSVRLTPRGLAPPPLPLAFLKLGLRGRPTQSPSRSVVHARYPCTVQGENAHRSCAMIAR